MIHLRTSLQHRVGRSPTDGAQLDRMAAAAWHRGSDLVTVRLSRVASDWTRQEIINEANRQHGQRKEKGRCP